jgi:hypothetical protein
MTKQGGTTTETSKRRRYYPYEKSDLNKGPGTLVDHEYIRRFRTILREISSRKTILKIS